MWMVAEQWLELSDRAELGAAADCGTWEMLDENLQVDVAGF
jgi:hypothetical protein